MAGARPADEPAYNARSQMAKRYGPGFGVTGQKVILANPEAEKNVGTVEFGATIGRLSERLCSIGSLMRQEGPIVTEKMEKIVSQQAAAAMGARIRYSVLMDVGRARAPSA